jgi:hypothetical protein
LLELLSVNTYPNQYKATTDAFVVTKEA